MKKIVALVLCLVMLVGLMAGCQKKMDADTLYQKMTASAKAVTAQAMDAEMDLEMKLSTMGVTVSMLMDLEMAMQLKTDFSAMHTDMTVNMEAMGQSEKTSAEVYMAREDDSLVSYIYDSASDVWVKSAQDGYQEFAAQFEELAKELALDESKLPKGTLTLGQEQITVNDRKCYVLTQQMDGASMQSFMSQYMEQILNKALEEAGTEIDAESQEAMDLIKNLDWSKLSYHAIYHVDAETFLPQEVSLEIMGLGETLNDMIGTLMEATMMEMDEENPAFAIEIPSCTISMKNMVYNEAVEVPAISQEAIDNAIDTDEMTASEEYYEEDLELKNPPQPDGSYLLSMGQTSIRIVVPADYSVYLSDDYSLDAMTENMEVMVSYLPFEGYTGAEMMLDYEAQVQVSKEEKRWLSNEVTEGANGFTVANLVYNDGVYEVVAWKNLDGGVMVVSVSSFEFLPEVDEILNNIGIG